MGKVDLQVISAVLIGMLLAVSIFIISALMLDKAFYMFLAPVAIVGGWFCVYHPHFALLLLIALIPLDTFAYLSNFGANISLFKLLTPFVAIGYLRLRFVAVNVKPFKLNHVEIAICFFILYCILVIPFSIHIQPAITFVRKLISVALLFFLTTHLSELGPKTFKKHVLIVLLVSSCLSALFSFYTTIIGENIFSHFQDDTLVRISGASDISPNDYAYMIFLPIAISLRGIFKTIGKKRFLYICCCIILLLALVFTYSRSAIVALGISCFLTAIILGKKITGTHITILLITFSVSLPLLPDAFKDRMLTLISITESSVTEQELSLVRRANYYTVGLNIIKEHPFLGAGPGNFPALHASPSFQSIPEFYGSQRMPHNLYLQIVTETGLVGLVLFLVPIFIIIKNLRLQIFRANNIASAAPATCCLLALLSSLTMGLFLHLLLSKSFWITLSLCTIYLRNIKYGGKNFKG